MKYVSSLIVVESAERSKGFYAGLLGQKISMDLGANVAFEGGFAILEKSMWEKVLGDRPSARQANNAELYFEDDDVDGAASMLAGKGIEFVHPPREQPWRQKVLRCYDPDGHIVEIGESMERLCARLMEEGNDVAAISGLTSLPEGMIERYLGEYGKASASRR